jgi:putative membrane protein
MKKMYILGILGIVFGLLTYVSDFDTDLLVKISGISLLTICILANIYLTNTNKYIIYGFILTGSILYILEIIGANTGIIYGEFIYNTSWRPALWGTPVVMLFVWATLIIESYFMVYKKTANTFVRIVLPAVLLVILDLVIDPGAIHLRLWSWANGGMWYGIPLSNYVGWLILGIIGSFIFYISTKKQNLSSIQNIPMLYFYTLAFFSTYNVLYGIYVPGIIGFVLIIILSYKIKTKALIN